MKLLKALFKIFVVSSLGMAILIGAIVVYMKFYGAAQIKNALSELTGSRVEFTSVALNLNKRAASFKGFSVAGRVGFDKNIFDADTFTVILDKEKLEDQKRIAFDQIYISGAKLTIIRDKRGILNISLPAMNTASLKESAAGFTATAYADEARPKNPMFDILRNVKSIKIENSAISFEDSYGMSSTYKIWCDKFFADIVARQTGSGYLAVPVTMSLRLPQTQGGDGWAGVKASMAVYPDSTNLELTAETGNVDLRVFQPYFQRSTPFFFRSGRFSSRTDLRMHAGAVDSITTMYFRDLNLIINQHDPNAQFLQVSINRLAPYLKSGRDIVFDFVMTGSASHPQLGVGPKVKFAIGMVAMEEVAKAIGQMQKLQ